MDAKTLKEVRDIVEGSCVEIPAESSAFLEGTTVEMMIDEDLVGVDAWHCACSVTVVRMRY